MTESAWLDCTHPGCPRGTYADPRHLPNITAGGGWTCPLHDAAGVPGNRRTTETENPS